MSSTNSDNISDNMNNLLIKIKFFNAIDLINFLSDIRTKYNYAYTTLQLIRSAVSNLHPNQNILKQNKEINDFFGTLAKLAPPIKTHKPTINIQPTFNHLKQQNNNTISLSNLQAKLAFLLAVTCFFRTSDLHRIPFESVTLSPNNTSISLEVHGPKKRRKNRSIIKSFTIKAHSNPSICPVTTYKVFQDRRPICTATLLFINTLHPNNPIAERTIHCWLRRLLRISTAERNVSLRSIASSLAFQVGIPKEDIITMGNWTNSSTFEHHYRREHLSLFDFTNTLITLEDSTSPMNRNDDSDTEQEDSFYDANDSSI